jgi:hypothetical protein
MKKIVIASVIALASVSIVPAPTLRAQDNSGNSGTIQIKDPAEFNAYQMFSTQTDPKAKAAAGKSFLDSYPQSVVKATVLDQLIDTYQGLQDPTDTLDAAGRLLQIDPNNMKAIFISVFIKKQQCAKTSDPQTCDDAAVLARKGLGVPKPASVSDDDWAKQKAATYPVFHSTIALDAALSKKDFKTAQDEYLAELQLMTADQANTAGLSDTLLLAQAYAQPGPAQDLPKAIWYYARVWNFAPANYKAGFEKTLEGYYKRYHGNLDGLDAVKQQAMASVTPAGTFKVDPAKSPAEQIHDLITATPDLSTLALADKETVLALGSKEDQDKLWSILKDKETQVPGVVIETNPSQIKVAVTDDAKSSKVADFIVNLKTPLSAADQKLYQPGFEFKTQPAAELAGTYDSYTQVPATATSVQSAQIVLRDGFIQPQKKTPAHKPSAVHRKTSN